MSESETVQIKYLGHTELREFGIIYSRRHLQAMGDKGIFPPSHRLSPNRVAWRSDQINDYLRTRPTDGSPPPQLWPLRPTHPRGRGANHNYTKPQGRKPGGKVVKDAAGKYRYVVPPEAPNAP